MTAQINDVFRHKGTGFSISGISEGGLFDPSLLGMDPVGACTACYRGYQAVFAVKRSRLVLDTLYVNLMRDGGEYERLQGPMINGVIPTGPDGEFELFNNHYEGIDYHLEYTGGLLLADEFIEELYVHMGFQSAWKYKRVIELIFANGILKEEHDRSARMAEIRKSIIESLDDDEFSQLPPEHKVREFIEQCFDRTYRWSNI